MIGELLQFAAWRVSSNTCLLLSLHTTMWGFDLLLFYFYFYKLLNIFLLLILQTMWANYFQLLENIAINVRILFVCPNIKLYLFKLQNIFPHSDSSNIVMIHLSSCWKILPSPYISGCQCMGCKRWWSGYKIGANKAPRAGPGAGGREHSWESGSRKNFCRGKFATRRVCLTWAKNCVWKKG